MWSSSEKYGQPFVAPVRLFYILVIFMCLSTEIITIPLPTPTQVYQDYTTENILAENSTDNNL